MTDATTRPTGIWTAQDQERLSSPTHNEYLCQRLIGSYVDPETAQSSFVYSMELGVGGAVCSRCLNSGFGGSQCTTLHGTFSLSHTDTPALSLICKYTEEEYQLDTWGHYGGEDSWENREKVSKEEKYAVKLVVGEPIRLVSDGNKQFVRTDIK